MNNWIRIMNKYVGRFEISWGGESFEYYGILCGVLSKECEYFILKMFNYDDVLR